MLWLLLQLCWHAGKQHTRSVLPQGSLSVQGLSKQADSPGSLLLCAPRPTCGCEGHKPSDPQELLVGWVALGCVVQDTQLSIRPAGCCVHACAVFCVLRVVLCYARFLDPRQFRSFRGMSCEAAGCMRC